MNTQYAARLARHRDELDWLFMELYDDRDALNRFYAMLEEADASRPQRGGGERDLPVQFQRVQAAGVAGRARGVA